MCPVRKGYKATVIPPSVRARGNPAEGYCWSLHGQLGLKTICPSLQTVREYTYLHSYRSRGVGRGEVGLFKLSYIHF